MEKYKKILFCIFTITSILLNYSSLDSGIILLSEARYDVTISIDKSEYFEFEPIVVDIEFLNWEMDTILVNKNFFKKTGECHEKNNDCYLA